MQLFCDNATIVVNRQEVVAWSRMEIEILTIEPRKDSLGTVFAKYKSSILKLLASSYQSYYGDDYQLARIIEEHSVIYLAVVDGVLVGVSYIKRNCRRGGTAVFPEEFRRTGIAERLVRESFVLFPKQYTILRADNHQMISLMEKVGFKKAMSIQEIERIVQEEFSQLSDFELLEDYMVFKRRSIRREIERERLTLLHTY